MKQLLLLLAITAVLLALPPISVAETISAYFEGDPAAVPTPVDTWKGVAGEGWSGPWATKKASNSSTIACTLTNTSPLATGTNNYVSTVLDAVAANDYVTIGRRYDRNSGPAIDKIDVTQDYTISFLFRVDEELGTGTTFYTDATDRFQLYQSTATSLASGSSGSSTWIIGAYGGTQTAGDGHTISAGNWVLDDYTTPGSGTGYKWDSGISISQGVTAFDITVHPNYYWDATITTATSSYTKRNMAFRSAGLTGGYVEFCAKASGGNDFRKFSVDSVVIQEIPEPSIVAMGLGVVLAGLATRQRRQ